MSEVAILSWISERRGNDTSYGKANLFQDKEVQKFIEWIEEDDDDEEEEDDDGEEED